MSENFLSFISNVEAKSADAGVPEAASVSEKSSQGVEFNSILEKERSKTPGSKVAGGAVGEEHGSAMKSAEGIQTDDELDVKINPDAPVALPVSPASGNPLPGLSIHSAALKVGRVILTSANPKVSEESLSQFARSQGTDIPRLMAGSSERGPIRRRAKAEYSEHFAGSDWWAAATSVRQTEPVANIIRK